MTFQVSLAYRLLEGRKEVLDFFTCSHSLTPLGVSPPQPLLPLATGTSCLHQVTGLLAPQC